MATAQKFTFDYSFDLLESGPPPAAPATEPEAAAKPEPMHSEAELETVRRLAYEEGRAAGDAEARADVAAHREREIEDAIAAATAEIGRQLGAIAAALTENRDLSESTAARVGAAVARKATPAFARQQAGQTVEAIVRDVLSGLIEEPRIAVNVSDAALDEIKTRLDGLKNETGFPGDFIVIADPDLTGSDCRVQWSDGGLETSYERVWGEIDRVLGAFHAQATASRGDADQRNSGVI